MSSIEQGFTPTQLRELASYRDVEEVTKELKAIKGRKVDIDDSASLKQRLADLARIEQLDLTAAHEAFRLDIVREGEGFLPLLSRISLLYGFDPARIALQNEAHNSDVADQKERERRDLQLGRLVWQEIAMGNRAFANEAQPLGDARTIESQLLRIKRTLIDNTPGPVGMKSLGHFFVGQAASADVLVAEEPRLTKLGDETAIEYEVPTQLHGVTDIQVKFPYGKTSFDPTGFGELFTEVDGEITAHPSLDAVTHAMLTRRKYRESYGPYIGEETISTTLYRDIGLLNSEEARIRYPRDGHPPTMFK